MITIHIPVPPSTNNLFANVAKRGRVRSERYNAWLRVAGTELNLQSPQPIAGLVSVDLMMKRPNASSDIDNRIKAALDLLVLHRLIEDDKNIVDVRARWGAVEDCVVTVRAA
jgi:crossover junction endodeoxyribonuclease RusA